MECRVVIDGMVNQIEADEKIKEFKQGWELRMMEKQRQLDAHVKELESEYEYRENDLLERQQKREDDLENEWSEKLVETERTAQQTTDKMT